LSAASITKTPNATHHDAASARVFRHEFIFKGFSLSKEFSIWLCDRVAADLVFALIRT
jgi:hypothetical protein